MATIVQRPARLDFAVVEGDPFSITVNVTVNDDPADWGVYELDAFFVSDAAGDWTVTAGADGVAVITAPDEIGHGDWAWYMTLSGVEIVAGRHRVALAGTPRKATSSSATIEVSMDQNVVNVDVTIGGGAGGGATTLNGLTDVVVTGAAAGDVLQRGATQWTNVALAGLLDADDIADTATTHKFTTAADITKLAGVEVGATADQTAAEILTAVKTVDGTGSGLDADTVDGQHAAAFATAAQGATADTAVQPARTIATTLPLTGGGDLSGNRTLAVNGSTDTAAGVVELATTAEATTGSDTVRAVTPAGLKAAIDAAIAALIASAPGALDTLNELAAALGDDPNFAASVTTALAGKQPVDGDLTAISSLTTTTYGRALLELANQAALMALLSAASTSAAGIVELATSAETIAGSDTQRAVTPAGGAAAYATAAQGSTADAAVPKSLYDSNTILAATSDNTPAALTVGASTIVGRKASGGIVALSGAEALTIVGGAPSTGVGLPWEMEIALSDETTAITTGDAKVTFRMPCAVTLNAGNAGVRLSCATSSSSGLPTVDINEAGSTILSTKVTLDANERTSLTAAAAVVISDVNLADDAEITVDIDVAGTGCKGLKLVLRGVRA